MVIQRRFTWSNHPGSINIPPLISPSILSSTQMIEFVSTGDDYGIEGLKQHLFLHLQNKVLGSLQYFLEIEVAQQKTCFVISQRKCALDILEQTRMLTCKPDNTTMDLNIKLLPDLWEPNANPGKYQRLAGKLSQLTVTRPKIFFSISVASQFFNSPCKL